MLRFHLRGPLTKAEEPPPETAPTAVFVMVNKLVEVVTSWPDVNVSVPDKEIGPLKVTPALLLIVKLFAPVMPLPVT